MQHIGKGPSRSTSEFYLILESSMNANHMNIHWCLKKTWRKLNMTKTLDLAGSASDTKGIAILQSGFATQAKQRKATAIAANLENGFSWRTVLTGKVYRGIVKHASASVLFRLTFMLIRYHKQFFHGISSVSGRQFMDPIDQRWGDQDAIEGLCHQCRHWISICTSKRKNSVLWYRHAHKVRWIQIDSINNIYQFHKWYSPHLYTP